MAQVEFSTTKNNTDLAAFNTKQQAFNDAVASWNAKGGAPQADYDALQVEKSDLEKESERLKSVYASLSDTLVTINAKIVRHNDLVTSVNAKIDANNVNANKAFTEGFYDPNTHEITIYQYTDEIHLERVLAHELGHALGMNHNDNPDSIMYFTNIATTTLLTKDDKDALRDVCSQS